MADVSFVTLNGGAGDDTIYNPGDFSMINYAEGDGSDVIHNYESTSIINITSGTYSTQISGSDTIIKVGNGQMTLLDYIDTININGTLAGGISTQSGSAPLNISNSNSNTIISGTSYADSIYNNGSNVTISTGAGNDTISNYDDSQVYMNGETGADYFYTHTNTSNVTINGGAGNDSIYSDGINIKIDSGSDNDYIQLYNKSQNVTINSGTGNDTINGASPNSIIDTGDGNDSVHIYNDETVIAISTGSGDDTISSGGQYLTIDGGAGNDSIYLYIESKNTKINGGIGKDSIHSGSENIKIDAGADNDYIKLYDGSKNNTIIAGTGNDTITLTSGASNNTISYASGDGNDVIYGFNSNNAIKITSGTYSTQCSGSDTIIKIGSGQIRLKNAFGISPKIITNDEPSGETETSISNSASNVLISGTSNADTIVNSGSNVTINGDAGNDSIVGGSGKDYIYGGNGVDTLLGNGGADYLEGGNGNDFISGGAGADTLVGGKGSDTLTGGNGDDVFVYANGDDNDVITDYAVGDKLKITGAKISNASVSGSNVVITVGIGKITLRNAKGKTLSIYNNSISLTSTVIGGSSSSSTLKTITDSDSSPVTVDSAVKLIDASSRTKAIKIIGNALANTIRGGSGVDTIYGGSGNDFILGNNGADKLFGDAGNDTIYGGSGNDSINGGTGVDKLYGDSGNDTLVGGKGGDTLTGGGGNDVFVYANGDGNDVIQDYNSSDKVSIVGSTKYTTQTSGSDFIINVGSGKITVKDTSDVNIVGGTAPAPTIDTGLVNVNLKNTPYTAASNVRNIDASSMAKAVEIVGNDNDNSIKGGTGTNLITGGKGNDTLIGGVTKNKESIFIYANGDGNDVILNANSSDPYPASYKISLTGGASISDSSVKGDDIVLKIGTGSITLKNARGRKITVIDSSGNEVTKHYGIKSALDVIKNFVHALDKTKLSGKMALDEAIKSCSNFVGIRNALENFIKDCTNVSSDTVLRNCGINLKNDDTGAITGLDAGGSVSKSSKSIVSESGSLKTVTPGSSEVINGVTIKYPSKGANGKSLDNKEKQILNALHTWWIKEGLDLNKLSYDMDFNGSDTTCKEIEIQFYDAHDNTYANAAPNRDWRSSYIKKIYLNINMYNYDNLKSLAEYPDGDVGNTKVYLDRTISHELNHAIFLANINKLLDLPKFIVEGMAEITHGIDDKRRTAIENLASGKKDLSDFLILIQEEENKIINAEDNQGAYIYAAGYMFLRYLAKNALSNSIDTSLDDIMANGLEISNGTLYVDSEYTYKDAEGKIIALSEYDETLKGIDASSSELPLVILGDYEDNTLKGSVERDTIKGGKGNDLITGNSGNDFIDGGSGNDTLKGDTGNDSLNGGSGNDTLIAGKGRDTLFGGKGKDVFVFGDNDGNNLITDFNINDNDVIKFTVSGDVNSSTDDGDGILSMGNTNITIKGAEGKTISVITASKDTKKITFTGEPASGVDDSEISLGDSRDSIFTADQYVATISAASRKKAIKIIGNSLGNSIIGGKGDDTLQGNEGNDILKGGAGNDVFVYEGGDGDDTITDYAEYEDDIQLVNASLVNSSVKGLDVILKVKDTVNKVEGKITIKNGKDKNISVKYVDDGVVGNVFNDRIIETWFMDCGNSACDELDSILNSSSPIITTVEFNYKSKDSATNDFTNISYNHSDKLISN